MLFYPTLFHQIYVSTELAETALKPAMKYAMQYALGDLVSRGQGISIDSFEAYNHYTQF